MTYCIGVMLDKGMIFASDSRTNAGMDNIAKFCKMTVFERPGDRPTRRRHEMRAGVVRFDDAEQLVGGHAHRPHLLRTGRARNTQAPPVRPRRPVFRRAQPRMERRHAAGVSPVAGAALVGGQKPSTPSSSR